MNDTAETAAPLDERIEEAIIRRSRESFERLPTLEMVIDRMTLTLASEMKSYCSVMPDIQLDTIDYVSCEEAMGLLPSPCLIAVVAADPWNATLACAIEPDLLFSVLEIMLGGQNARASAWTPRSFTAIERSLGQKLVQITLKAMETSFSNVTSVTFTPESTETMPKSVVLSAPVTPSVRIRLKVTMQGREGHLSMVIPHGGHEEVRALLAQPYMGGRLGGDTGWRRQLNEQISETEINLTAVLHEVSVPLRTVLAWTPGQVLNLGVTADQPITAVVDAKPVFSGTLGQRANGSLAIRISEILMDPKEDEHASRPD